MGTLQKIILAIEIRFRDIDAMGHVNNAVFFTYFEEGRKAFLEKVLGIVDPSEYPFILAHIHCDYRAPLKLGDHPLLEVWVGETGEKKFTFRYRLADKKNPAREFGSGESVMVFYDYEAGRSIPIPQDIRERLEPYAGS